MLIGVWAVKLWHKIRKKKQSSNKADGQSSTTAKHVEVSNERKASSPFKEQNCKKVCPNSYSNQKKRICLPNPNFDKIEKISSNSKTVQKA